MTQKAPRQLNIELLRIVCMLEITALHYLYGNGAILLASNAVSGLRIAGSVIESLCIPSVACYVLISGYCDRSTEFQPGRIGKIILQVWFWSVLLHLVCAAAGLVPLYTSVWDLATYVLPIMTGHYWFASAFVVMELFAPLLNAAAERVSRKTLQGVILGLLFYESIFKTVLPFQLNQDAMGYDFGFFLMVFLVGAYLRIYGVPRLLGTKGKAFAGYLGSCGVIALVQIAASLLHVRTGSFSWLMSTPFHYNFLFAVTGSVCLFLTFAQWEMNGGKAASAAGQQEAGCAAADGQPRQVQTAAEEGISAQAPRERFAFRAIRALAPLTFGVYLIQCHADLLPDWPGRAAGLAGMSAETSGAALFFLWMIIAVLIVFAVCSALEAIRKRIFDGVLRAAGRR